MKTTEAKKLVAMLVASFGKDNIGDDTIAIYANRLTTIPLEDGTRAVIRLIDTATFFPRIAEILELATGPDVDDRLPSFGACITELKAMVSRGANFGGPGLHPLTFAACEAIGGVSAWRQAPDENNDPRGYQHAMRRMRETYTEARDELRAKAIGSSPEERDRLLGPPKPKALPPPKLTDEERRAAEARSKANDREHQARLRDLDNEKQKALAPRQGRTITFGRRR